MIEPIPIFVRKDNRDRVVQPDEVLARKINEIIAVLNEADRHGGSAKEVGDDADVLREAAAHLRAKTPWIADELIRIAEGSPK